MSSRGPSRTEAGLSVVCGPRGAYQGVHQGNTLFIIIDLFCFFHWVDVYADSAKARMGESAGTVAVNTGEALNWIRSHCISGPPYLKFFFIFYFFIYFF